MKSAYNKSGLTGVEIMVAVAVLAVLVAAVIGIGGRLRTQGNIELAKSTITLLDAAMEQYYDYWKDYPPDCNYSTVAEFETILKFGDSSRNVAVINKPSDAEFRDINSGYASIAGMYICMSRTPASAKVLGKIQDKAISTEIVSKASMGITIDSRDYPLFYVVDPWKKPLRYSRTWVDPSQSRTAANFKGFTKDFPKVESAGPDGKFGTEDDIK